MRNDESAEPASQNPPLNLNRISIIAAIIAFTVVSSGIIIRKHQGSDVQTWTQEQAIPSVMLIAPQHDQTPDLLQLPGHLQAYYEAPIFARVSGYLKHWNVDIGAHVRPGQVLAEIETPTIDQQFKQAQADLADAVSKQKLAKITSKRWKNLLASDSVSQQEADQKAADLVASQSEVDAAEDNVNRVRALKSFQQVIAPFDGIVTARETDIGALINAGSSSGAELFKIAEVDKLRLYVQIPQIYAAKIRIGMEATLTVPEHPSQDFPAIMTNNAGAINSSSGTMLAEFAVDNKAGTLTSGSYTEVQINLPENASTVRVPASALIVRHGGVQVASVDKNHRVVLKKVLIGLDMGTEVEILSGLDPNERIIDSPPDSLEQGDLVRVKESTALLSETNASVSGARRE